MAYLMALQLAKMYASLLYDIGHAALEVFHQLDSIALYDFIASTISMLITLVLTELFSACITKQLPIKLSNTRFIK